MLKGIRRAKETPRGPGKCSLRTSGDTSHGRQTQRLQGEPPGRTTSKILTTRGWAPRQGRGRGVRQLEGAVRQVQKGLRKAPALLSAASPLHRQGGSEWTGLGAERRTPDCPLHSSPSPRLLWQPPWLPCRSSALGAHGRHGGTPLCPSTQSPWAPNTTNADCSPCPASVGVPQSLPSPPEGSGYGHGGNQLGPHIQRPLQATEEDMSERKLKFTGSLNTCQVPITSQSQHCSRRRGSGEGLQPHGLRAPWAARSVQQLACLGGAGEGAPFLQQTEKDREHQGLKQR